MTFKQHGVSLLWWVAVFVIFRQLSDSFYSGVFAMILIKAIDRSYERHIAASRLPSDAGKEGE